MKPSEEPVEIPESVQRGVVVADQVTGNIMTDIVSHDFPALVFVVAKKGLVTSPWMFLCCRITRFWEY